MFEHRCRVRDSCEQCPRVSRVVCERAVSCECAIRRLFALWCVSCEISNFLLLFSVCVFASRAGGGLALGRPDIRFTGCKSADTAKKLSEKKIKPILRLPKTYQPRRPNTYYLLVWIVQWSTQWRMCARPSLGRRTVYQVPAPEMPPMTTSFEGSYSAVSPYGATAISKRPSSRYFLELQRIIQPEPGVSITVW